MIKQLLNKLPLSKPYSKSPPNHHLSSSPLPPLTSLPLPSRPALFLHKLSLSSALSDPADSAAFDLKRQLLLDLVDYLSSSPPRFTDPEILAAARMISANLFRPLPPSPARPTDYSPDPDDDPPSPDPSWPHLHLVYDFLLHFLSSQETDPKLAKRHFDRAFVLRLLHLFDSEDHRERDYLKSVLHRFYGKFMTHRPFIRKAINDILYCFIFETERHNGIAELLEILGSVINGFALPLKEEHKMFLARALVPLHKPKCIASYHHQLSYCIVQFVEKDVELADVVIRGILKYWPVTNSLKEVMFIGELEEILEAMDVAEFRRCMVQVFRQISRCLNSSHFQVAERALFLWNNDHISNLITQNRKVILPIIFQALERNTRGGHWNLSVQSLSLSVRKLFLDADQQLFNECLLRFQEDSAKENEVRERREQNWRRLEDVAASKSTSSNEAAFVSQMISSLSLATKRSQTVVGI